MDQKRVKRKLRAILSADVQGYSRLMGDDEVATFKTITEYREIFASIVSQYNGRVVDSPGDNILSEFASVVDAVQCAVEIQKVLKAKNEELPENRRMIFRIGVNLGDVIHEDDRIYGDGVNIAARIESLADGGGICISGSAYEQIENKLALGYNFIGEHSVKNIAKPIKVYKVPMEPGERKEKKTRIKTWHWAALALLVLILVGSAFWNFYLPTQRVEPASLEKMAFPLPDKPSIAVLPFDNLGTDSKYKHLGDSITENIITSLSKIPKLFVIARNSTSIYKGKPVKIQQVSEELGARYVLEGSVQTEGEDVRVTAQLIDAVTGHHLWAERYNRKIKDLFAVMDEITLKIIAALQVKLTEGEQAHLWARGTDNLNAYLKFIQARSILETLNRENNARARQMFEEVIALDKNYVSAYWGLVWTYLMDQYYGNKPKEAVKKAMHFAHKGLAIDESNADIHAVLGECYLRQRQYEKAISECERAIDLNPNLADAYFHLGRVLHHAGKHKEAVKQFKKAIRLNPMPQSYFYLNLGFSYQHLGKHEDAIKAFKETIRMTPKMLFPYLRLAASYSLLGQDEDARAWVAEVYKINPNFRLESIKNVLLHVYKNQSDADLIIGAMQKAGLK